MQFAEAYAAEDVVLQTARSLADEVGLAAVAPGAGAVLRLLAAAGSAKAVVEIGTGTGVSGVWLLRGMRPDGVLTTIDVETEHQRIARRIFVGGRASPPSRTRIITGRALDVLPRLADGVYDLVFVDADADRVRRLRRTPRCGCCARAACWRSTARWPAAGSATRRPATSTRSTHPRGGQGGPRVARTGSRR